MYKVTHMFKHFPQRNHWADSDKILYGMSMISGNEIYIFGRGQMTKMETMPIYGKTLKNPLRNQMMMHKSKLVYYNIMQYFKHLEDLLLINIQFVIAGITTNVTKQQFIEQRSLLHTLMQQPDL